eukprot:TRINITY_DN10963_c0_g1_i1.p1 TRINITY_DN10963_c0_g1~~TRINITY_DN10963_c0_g1_i1.p1  ORF type:complete len:298 (-),score=57.02 TRINITY_DN10963_c0_g1_i1:12-848(-)
MIPRPCCLAGHAPLTTPKGTTKTIGGYKCYSVGEENEKVVMVAPDVFGLSPHLKTLCDHFSELGYHACAVDYFEGTAMPDWILESCLPFVLPEAKQESNSFFSKLLKFLLLVWTILIVLPPVLIFVWRHLRKTKIAEKPPILTRVANELLKKKKNIGLVGYCYGGRIVVLFATSSSSCPFKVFAEAHGEVQVANIHALKHPTLFCCASNDWSFPESRVVEAEKIIAEKFPPNTHQIIRYPGTYHGFAVRGDESNPIIEKAKSVCMHDVAGFFEKEFKK